MQHVRIGDDDVAVDPDCASCICWRIAIEGAGAYLQVADLVQGKQLGHLILGQRLGRKQVQRFGTATQHSIEYRQVVAQAFS